MEGKDYSGLKYIGGMTFEEYCNVNEEIYRGDPLILIQLNYHTKHSEWKFKVDYDEIEAGFKEIREGFKRIEEGQTRIEAGIKRLDDRIKDLNNKIDYAEKGIALTCEILSLA